MQGNNNTMSEINSERERKGVRYSEKQKHVE
jgi:hypothetical protein